MRKRQDCTFFLKMPSQRRYLGKNGDRAWHKGVDNGSNGVWTVAGSVMRTTIKHRGSRQCSCKVSAMT